MVVTFMDVESSIVQLESPLSEFVFDVTYKFSNRKKQTFFVNVACVFIKPPLMLMMIMVVPIVSITTTWRYEKTTNLERDVDEINELP